MTAVVGILNKQAVALAADSAVTFESINGNRIFNRANKLFSLSKHHPIGVMIYNSATFMGVPWETIIKMYRKQLKDTSFPTVREYQENFINYLKSKSYFSTPDEQLKILQKFSRDLILEIFNSCVDQNVTLVKDRNNTNDLAFLAIVEAKTDELINQFSQHPPCCDEMKAYTFEEFENYFGGLFETTLDDIFNPHNYQPSAPFKIKLKQVVYYCLLLKEELSSFTGIIFTGFGEDEIYPSLIAVDISFAFDNRLRYYINKGKSSSISSTVPGAICPFAQTDVIDTILLGIDPSLDETYLDNFRQTFLKYNQEIVGLIGNSNQPLSDAINNLDINQIIQKYAQLNLEIKQQKYIYPLMNAISSLSKEDLSEMAESLIYLTYLKRRITFAEESVGGPVDVALISKGDGFIWIKRKHYFKPELNKHFFNNYFNS